MPVFCSRCGHSAFTVTADHGPLCREHYLQVRHQIRPHARFRTVPCPQCGTPILGRLDSDSPVPMKCPQCHSPAAGGVDGP